MMVTWQARASTILLLLGAAAHARANELYVAPNGNDTNAGTLDQPFASMAHAQAAASPGDTVYFRAGVYAYTSSSDADGVVLDKSGSSGKPIRYWAYAGEVPVFDFSAMSAQARITGFRVTASWLHLKGLELKGVPQNITTQHESWGIYNTGSHNIYEGLDLHHNMGPGLFIAKGGDNLVLNCDSHHNYDPKSSSGDGTNADGFGCHIEAGATGNVFRGCRAYFNSDDGFDFIQAQEPVTVESSWAFSNGYQPETMTAKGDGNGFKGGGYGLPATNVPASPPSHTVRFCVAFQNRASGFYANHHPVAGHWYSNTAFRNSADFNMLGLNGNVGILRNNVAYGGTLLSNGSGVDDASNSWSLPVTVSDADFESVSTSGMDGPRQADGTLPRLGFLRLQAGSDLIDKGQDVGLPFNDAAPDLGAFESGPPLAGNAGTGGMGAAGAGGASMVGSGGVGASGSGVGTSGAGARGSAGTGATTAASGGSSGGSAGQTAVSVAGSAGSGGAAPTTNAGASGSRGPSDNSGGGGCSCRIAHGPARVPISLWLALLAFVARRRWSLQRAKIAN